MNPALDQGGSDLYVHLAAINELDRVVDWATRRVTIHPAFLDDLRQEILIELTKVRVRAEDPVKLGATVASRICLKFKAQYHGPIKFPDCAAANRARSRTVDFTDDDAASADFLSLDEALQHRDQATTDEHVLPTPDASRLAAVLDSLSPALYRVARHIARGENIAFIAATEGMTEGSVRTVMHRIQHAIEATSPRHAID